MKNRNLQGLTMKRRVRIAQRAAANLSLRAEAKQSRARTRDAWIASSPLRGASQ
jgi:hypothetical protein